jgi:hypothetical protein
MNHSVARGSTQYQAFMVNRVSGKRCEGITISTSLIRLGRLQSNLHLIREHSESSIS